MAELRKGEYMDLRKEFTELLEKKVKDLKTSRKAVLEHLKISSGYEVTVMEGWIANLNVVNPFGQRKLLMQLKNANDDDFQPKIKLPPVPVNVMPIKSAEPVKSKRPAQAKRGGPPRGPNAKMLKRIEFNDKLLAEMIAALEERGVLKQSENKQLGK